MAIDPDQRPFTELDQLHTVLVSAYDDRLGEELRWPDAVDDLYTLWYLRSGAVTIRAATGRVQVASGRWVMLPPGLRRAQRFRRDTQLLSLRFRATWPHDRPLFPHAGPLLPDPARWKTLLTPATALAAVCGPQRTEGLCPARERRSDPARYWQVAARFADLLAHWYACCRELGLTPAAPGPRDPRIAAALPLLEAHRGTGPVPYPALLTRSGLSRVHFDRLFRAEMGCSPRAYCDRRCLDQARALLADPQRAIKQIAHQLGFTDASHFAKWFRRRTGAAPRAWRRRPPGV